jgi:hypothetical protein
MEPGKDEIPVRASRATQNPQNFHIHRLRHSPFENGPRGPMQAAMHLAQRVDADA